MKWIYKISYKHKLLFIFVAILSNSKGYGQASLTYTLLKEDTFHIGVRKHEGFHTDMVRTYPLLNDDGPFLTYTPLIMNSYFPHVWRKETCKMYAAYGYGDIVSRGRIKLQGFNMERLDSIQRQEVWNNLRIETKKTYPNVDSLTFESLYMKEVLRVYGMPDVMGISPLLTYFHLRYDDKEAIKNLIRHISYDFLALEDRNFKFYTRSDKDFTIWKTHFPIEFKEEVYWKDQMTYTTDSIYIDPVPDNFKISRGVPNEDKYSFNAIQDTLFFHGHFTVFAQGKHTFILNRQHGGLYYIAPDKIQKIGQVEDIENYPTSLFGKQLFIEDMDRQVILLSSKVKQLRKDTPYPKIKYIKPFNSIEQFKANIKAVK